eukprot:gene6003-biopygen7273
MTVGAGYEQHIYGRRSVKDVAQCAMCVRSCDKTTRLVACRHVFQPLVSTTHGHDEHVCQVSQSGRVWPAGLWEGCESALQGGGQAQKWWACVCIDPWIITTGLTALSGSSAYWILDLPAVVGLERSGPPDLTAGGAPSSARDLMEETGRGCVPHDSI